MEDSHANRWQAKIPCAQDIKYIHQQNTRKNNNFQFTTTKEEYHNILNELLELPSMPDIGEPGVMLAAWWEQWKSDLE